MSLHNTALAAAVEALQDAGRNVWLWGFTADGRRALVADADNDRATIAPVDAPASLGRWECSLRHLNDYADLYCERFPRRV
jgi:hypothetical protein